MTKYYNITQTDQAGDPQSPRRPIHKPWDTGPNPPSTTNERTERRGPRSQSPPYTGTRNARQQERDDA
jgi:hypothetical protein